MAIEVFLRDENGRTIDSVFGANLAPLMPAIDDASSPCLRFIDPYGDTIFNQSQSALLCTELLDRLESADGIDRGSLERVAELLEQCRDGIHLYVWFVGD